ncbi:MAG: GvpL/GvpF family gas vesicle protein [Desulfobaccales bacterium]
MAERTSKPGRYLYAVVPGPLERTFDFTGLNGSEVYTISNGRVAAIVSDIPDDKIRPERRHLAAQQGVLKRLVQEMPGLLPMSFGIIADGPKTIKKILSQNQEALVRQLQRVAGKIEMGLRVSWDVPNIFEYFVNTHPELQSARDRFLGPQRNPSQEDKIELGRLFDRLLQEDRENFTDRVERVLSRSCREIKRNKCRQEHEVMNLACLVPREILDGFEETVFAAANLFDNNYSFDYNGPWAPHNFVTLDLKL